jgi:RNA polymerase sporulation-specific sigma factor
MPSVIDEDKLVTENMGLINMAIKRYLGFGVDYEDLFQIGAVGLIKAARGFDASKNLKFSTYAVAKIIGEVKTYLRDNGEIKVPRSVKEQKFRIERTHTELLRELGREPRISEISQRCGIAVDDIVYALDATQSTVSLDLPPDEGGVTVGSDGQEEEQTLNRVMIAQLLSTLQANERRLIVLRFFNDKTQAEISKELGLSQVAVSRLEKKVLQKLKEKAVT